MGRYVVGLAELDRSDVAIAGGKAANLGELSHVEGIDVPAGFCVTTDAFARVVAATPSIIERLERLTDLEPDDREGIAASSAEVRAILEAAPVPGDMAAEIGQWLGRFEAGTRFAVRSSATAEDLPGASFAGQHDSFLDVASTAVSEHVRRCWASLFTERAVTYRLHHGIGHNDVRMAVVVQEMVDADGSGVLFTADPVTGNRRVVDVEAVVGLGDALVSGLVAPDVYGVRGDTIVSRTERQRTRALTDEQVVRLAQLGRRVEAHFGHPQDIEWCRADEDFRIVQSRPITTLYPVPAADDGERRLYVSVGHQQMMTDAMKPLGLSLWLATTPAPMAQAGGRLFIDVTRALSSPASQAGLLDGLGRSDPLIGDALRTVVERGDVLPPPPAEAAAGGPPGGGPPGGGPATAVEPDPAVVAGLVERAESSLAALQRDMRDVAGPALIDAITADIGQLRGVLFDPGSHRLIMAAVEATNWLNEHLEAWLGEKNAADTLAQSAPGNVTSQMGLALLDVADAVRPHPQVVAFLQQVDGDDFMDELSALPGGGEAREAIDGYLDAYGMRCVGEIDVTRPRWRERPSALVPMILANVANFAPGEAARRFAQGLDEARNKERQLLQRLRTETDDGESRAEQTRRMIDLLRTFIGFREYPKYHMVGRYFVYKQALLAEADRLVDAGVLTEREDIYYLTLEELRDVARTHQVDGEVIRRRQDEFSSYQALTPPRVITSDGEVVTGSYRRVDLPAGALEGLAVSAGTVEGRARVALDMAGADLAPGDILVTAYTDPSWTPAFVAIAGLVTEVGGLMTHGAVVAREYGLPAVVGVEGATRRIRDGQRIRVNGTDGYVETLPEPARAR